MDAGPGDRGPGSAGDAIIDCDTMTHRAVRLFPFRPHDPHRGGKMRIAGFARLHELSQLSLAPFELDRRQRRSEKLVDQPDPVGVENVALYRTAHMAILRCYGASVGNDTITEPQCGAP